MEIITHKKIDSDLCGLCIEARPGFSRVRLQASRIMAVDEFDLVHGGFIFGLADYSAMIAVNHPNVVLGSAEVKFQKPIKVGDIVIAEAQITETKGKKKIVSVSMKRGDEQVFEGSFTCFILENHVLKNVD